LSVTVLIGDCIARMRELPALSADCCVTSPPYWGLRDYGTARWDGGDPACDHKVHAAPRSERPANGLEGGKATVDAGSVRRGNCPCGARRVDQQKGLEETPEQYVAGMVAVFREVRRVLRDDGTLWLNLGDSYAVTHNGKGGASKSSAFNDPGDAWRENVVNERRERGVSPGLKPKDLVGIPWRVAFALQADGWYLRSDIIWSKPNPMPESVTDRPTKAHEYVFLLTKSERYFFDAEAISENAVDPSRKRLDRIGGSTGHEVRHSPGGMMGASETRNARTVWDIATQPFSGAHFATMPPALAARCIRAGSREGGTVLDPFGGAGTTALVAAKLGRNAVLTELNPDYAAMAARRVESAMGLLCPVTVDG